MFTPIDICFVMIEVILNANGKVEVNIFSVEGGEEIFGHSVMGFGL